MSVSVRVDDELRVMGQTVGDVLGIYTRYRPRKRSICPIFLSTSRALSPHPEAAFVTPRAHEHPIHKPRRLRLLGVQSFTHGIARRKITRGHQRGGE